MSAQRLTRRQFVTAASLTPLATLAARTAPAYGSLSRKTSKLAMLGGKPLRAKSFPHWPIWDKDKDEEAVVKVLRSGIWSRAKVVAEFEQKYARLLGAKRCLATTNGTNALLTALSALGIGVGDEVLVGPYTFIATIDAILLCGALPIMVDTDPETFQVNPDKMEAKITPNTRMLATSIP